ncbi:MAG: reverse transcriptase-like protein [Firmicutes bacterium]|nr:reverse transcriptase-like protein [Bacillota bacterium]
MSPAIPALFHENAYPPKKRRPGKSSRKMMKIVIHYSSSQTGTESGLTVVLTSGKGRIVREIQFDFPNTSPERACLRGLLESLKIAERYKTKHIVIYINDERSALIASGDEPPQPDLIGLTLQVRALCYSFKSVDIRCGVPEATQSLLYPNEPLKKG